MCTVLLRAGHLLGASAAAGGLGSTQFDKQLGFEVNALTPSGKATQDVTESGRLAGSAGSTSRHPIWNREFELPAREQTEGRSE